MPKEDAAIEVDEAVVSYFGRISERQFKPIFNNSGASHAVNDGWRTQLEYEKLTGRIAASLKGRLTEWRRRRAGAFRGRSSRMERN